MNDGLIQEAKEYCETSHYLAESAPRGTMLRMIDAIEHLEAERDKYRDENIRLGHNFDAWKQRANSTEMILENIRLSGNDAYEREQNLEAAEERCKHLEDVILAASDEYEEDGGYVVVEKESRSIREFRDENSG